MYLLQKKAILILQYMMWKEMNKEIRLVICDP